MIYYFEFLTSSGNYWQKEIEELRNKLANVSSPSSKIIQNPKENYLQKLHVVEDQVELSLNYSSALIKKSYISI